MTVASVPELLRRGALAPAYVAAVDAVMGEDWAHLELGRGSDDDVVARSARFAATLGKVTDRYQRPLEYADLRHHDGYAVRLKGVSTTSAVTTDKKK